MKEELITNLSPTAQSSAFFTFSIVLLGVTVSIRWVQIVLGAYPRRYTDPVTANKFSPFSAPSIFSWWPSLMIKVRWWENGFVYPAINEPRTQILYASMVMFLSSRITSVPSMRRCFSGGGLSFRIRFHYLSTVTLSPSWGTTPSGQIDGSDHKCCYLAAPVSHP